MKTNLKVFGVLFLLTMVTVACNKDLITSPEVQEKAFIESDDVTFVSLSKATGIAEAFFGTLSNDPITKSSIRLASTETIGDNRNENKPLMYVMNYVYGGFVIISATKDYYPVLAYSDEGNFVLSEDLGSVAVWLEETEEAIRQSKNLDETNKAKVCSMWRKYDPTSNITSHKVTTKSLSSEKDDAMANRIGVLNSMGYSCYSLESAYVNGLISYNLYQESILVGNDWDTPEYTLVVMGTNYSFSQAGPLVSTSWVQQNSYNALCSNYPDPAGCGTIAIAQIMKFHEFPSTYYWSGMADTYPTNDSQILIRDINNRIGSSSTVNEEKSAFEYFGYNANVYNHDTQSVTLEIFNYNRPILMGGYTNSLLGIGIGDGHSWVCDGAWTESYSDFYYVEFLTGSPGDYIYDYDKNICTPQNPLSHGGYSNTYFHMNWGWNSSSTPDGWYLENDVNTYAGNFNHVRKNIYVSK